MIVPFLPPVAVSGTGGFDYVTVDAARRRVYAAHGGAKSLLIVDADKGTVIGQVVVGPMHGVAVDPADGHVFTGNGDDKSISEVDPVAMTVLRSVAVDGAVDAIAFDPTLDRIYADEDDGTRVFVIDAKTFKQIAVVTVPGHKPEYLNVNPATHEVYQNISDLGEVAVIDPTTLKVSRTFPTPKLGANHPLQFDPAYNELLVGGNGTLGAYDPSGKLLGTAVLPRVDQCDLDRTRHLLACAGGSKISLYMDSPAGVKFVDSVEVPRGAHTIAIDPSTGTIWIVWSDKATGAFVEGFVMKWTD